MPGESSAAPASVVVPTGKDGTPVPGGAVAATPMKGGMALSPLPLAGAGRRRKTKRLSKKVLKMMKKMTPKQLKKLMKGGEGEEGADASGSSGSSGEEQTGLGRRRKSRKTKRRSGLLY